MYTRRVFERLFRALHPFQTLDNVSSSVWCTEIFVLDIHPFQTLDNVSKFVWYA